MYYTVNGSQHGGIALIVNQIFVYHNVERYYKNIKKQLVAIIRYKVKFCLESNYSELMKITLPIHQQMCFISSRNATQQLMD